MTDLEGLRKHALRAGFTRVACPSCSGRDRTCGNCSGSGHLWATGSGHLDDRGLSRHRELERRREKSPS